MTETGATQGRAVRRGRDAQRQSVSKRDLMKQQSQAALFVFVLSPSLSFDIRSYRVIFYDTIAGKPRVERSLRKHLRSVLREMQGHPDLNGES